MHLMLTFHIPIQICGINKGYIWKKNNRYINTSRNLQRGLYLGTNKCSKGGLINKERGSIKWILF
jgi:hypothetical protein